MNGRGLWRKCAVLLAALLLLAAAVPSGMPTLAEAVPSGALIAPSTPKPWLVTPAAETTAPAPAETAAPSYTSPPSSLSFLETEDEQAPTETPTPTPSPTPQTDALPASMELEDAGKLRVLLIGTDAYDIDDTGRSDTMALVQINVETNEIRIISFLRDLYVKIPGHGKTRLNAAYVYGGEELLLQTLEDNFGVTADRTVAVNFSVMVELIDRIGGVTVDVSEKERVQLNSILKYYNTQNGYGKNDQLLQSAGEQSLTGKQALCFSRIRKIDSDFQRVGRQRKVLEAVYRQLRGMDMLTLTGLLYNLLPEVKTDLSITDAAALVPVLLNLEDVTFDSLTVPVSNGYSSQTKSGMDVLVPDLEKNRNAVYQFLQ